METQMSDQVPQADGQQGTSPRWRYFLARLVEYRGPLLLAAVAMLCDALLTVLRPWPLKVVIDRVIPMVPKPTRVPFLGHWIDSSGNDPAMTLYCACAATLLIALGTGLLTYAFTHIVGEVAQRFVFSLRRDLFVHLQRLSLRFHNRQRCGDLTSRLTSDIHSVQDIIANGTILLGSNACLLAGMVSIMLWLNWKFALAALSMAPVMFWMVLRSTHRIKAAAREARVSDGLLASVAQETLASIRIVQGLSQEDQQTERFQLQSRNSLKAHLQGVRYQARVAPLVDLLAASGLAIVMWYGATSVRAGELSTGDVVIFFAYVTNLYSPMKALARLSYSFNRASVGAERIHEVLCTARDVEERPGAQTAPRLAGHIEFRNVSFDYEGGRTVLSDINLTIAAGEKVAIVGVTGAGKSTLVGLLPRFFDPTHGELLVDGCDIQSYTLRSLRDNISLVLQDALLFSGTIRDNIAFGRPDASDDEIVAAAVQANADEFIQRLPDGYDTWIAERGNTLSGGQKQRLAIARAILRDAPILILDEPTSGLDAISERAVTDSLERASAGRTTLMITHRLTTARFANRIVVLDQGRLVESGTHETLLVNSRRYAEFFHLQQDLCPVEGSAIALHVT